MEQLDLSLRMMEDSRLRYKLNNIINTLVDETHFDRTELMSVLIIHHKICQNKAMGRMLFHDVMSQMCCIPNDEMIERIFAAIETPNSLGIGPVEWARLLSLFCRGTLDEKIIYCFKVYDNLNLGYIGRPEMMKLLKQTIIAKKQDAEDTAADLSDMLMRRFDLDRDGKISFRDYRESVRNNPHLLEPFGQCLPDRDACYTLMSIFTNDVSTYHLNYMIELGTTSECELTIHQRRKFAD